jgi:hypothetical protein
MAKARPETCAPQIAASRTRRHSCRRGEAPRFVARPERIHGELRRRAGYVASGQWDRCALPPFQRLPHNALGRVFVTKLVRPDLDFFGPHPLN